MPRAKRSVESSLQKKGFALQTGDHNFFVYWTISGLKSNIFTKTSHTKKPKDISDGLLSQMARQCYISKLDFLNLIDCPLSQEGYEKLLYEAGILEMDE
jgi:hypothetical protein